MDAYDHLRIVAGIGLKFLMKAIGMPLLVAPATNESYQFLPGKRRRASGDALLSSARDSVRIYEIPTGEPPFTGPTARATVARVLTDAPRSVRAQRQTIPEHVDAAVRKALEKLPADRFGTASEFAAALTDWLAAR